MSQSAHKRTAFAASELGFAASPPPVTAASLVHTLMTLPSTAATGSSNAMDAMAAAV